MRNQPTFPDHNQNYWQLFCIQGAAQGMPAFLLGGTLARNYGTPTAFLSSCVGHLILWAIGLAVISMASQEKKNAIENVRNYFGKPTGWVMAFFLLATFLSWFMYAIASTVDSFEPIVPHAIRGKVTLGTALGLVVTILSIGGINLIRRFCVSLFPLIFLLALYVTIVTDHTLVYPGRWSVSFSAILFVIGLSLPGYINLPTFFRHSRSTQHSYFALSLMTGIDIFFESITLFNGISDPSAVFSPGSPFLSHGLIFLLPILILLTLVSVNLVNIYFSSASFELVLPSVAAKVRYAVVGLAGTGAYIFLQTSERMEFLSQVANNCLSSLGVVLVASLLVRKIVRHRPRPLEKMISTTCWVIGCIVATFSQIHDPTNGNTVFISAITGSLIPYMVILFIEEGIWSTKKIISAKT